jgi:hypothetical protein
VYGADSFFAFQPEVKLAFQVKLALLIVTELIQVNVQLYCVVPFQEQNCLCTVKRI